jgi:hypothetical protein
MLTQLSDAVCNLNHSRLFFTQLGNVSSSNILYPVSLRTLRLRDHTSSLSQLLDTLTIIRSADIIEQCQLRDSLRFGHFTEVYDML